MTNITIPDNWSIDFSQYLAWTEFFPRQQSTQVLANFNVSPGDLIFSQVWVGNPGQRSGAAVPVRAGVIRCRICRRHYAGRVHMGVQLPGA